MHKSKPIIFVDFYSNSILPLYERMKDMDFDVHLVKPKKRIGFTKHLRPYWRKKVIPKAELYILAERDRHMTPLDKSVFLIHGIGLEEAIKFDEQYKAIFVTGPKWMDEYKRVFSKQHWHKLIPVGFPPVEKLLSREVGEKAKEIKEGLSLGEKPILLFGVLAETCEMESNLISRALLELENIADELHLNLIIKPNRYFRVWGPNFPHNRYVDLREKINRKSYIHIISPDESILPFYHISDILISGRCSSIITEFMTLDKPVIQLIAGISYPITLDRPSNIESMGDNATPYFDVGLRCETEILMECVKRSLENPNEFSKERKVWVNKSVYNPIGTIKRAIEGIEKLV